MWVVDVAPEMKASVMEGQPMFSLSSSDPMEANEKSAEQFRKEREEKLNNRYKDEKSKDLFLSLATKEGEDYNETAEEIARRTNEGLSSLYGEGEQDWRGKETPVSRVAEVISADTGRRSGATRLLSPPGTDVQRATQDKLQSYAESRGIWFDEKKIASDSDYITEAGESIVYRSKDGKTTIKMTYP